MLYQSLRISLQKRRKAPRHSSVKCTERQHEAAIPRSAKMDENDFLFSWRVTFCPRDGPWILPGIFENDTKSRGCTGCGCELLRVLGNERPACNGQACSTLVRDVEQVAHISRLLHGPIGGRSDLRLDRCARASMWTTSLQRHDLPFEMTWSKMTRSPLRNMTTLLRTQNDAPVPDNLHPQAMTDNTTTRTATPSHSLPPADASVQSCVHCGRSLRSRAAALAPDALCQKEVLRHEQDAPRVPCARVRILDDLHHVSLRRLLQKDETPLRQAEIRTHLLRDLSHEAYKGRPWQYRLGGGLVLANFP